MQYTTHYNFNKPEIGEYGLVSNFNDNSDTTDTVLYKHKINIANEYSDSATYVIGNFVMYEDVLYKCNTPVSTAETFDPTKWAQTSVVDAISGADYVELKTEQYTALTPEQKNNGTIYFLTDYGSSSSIYIQAIIYSTEERQVGVWTNGKPLYQKTVEGEIVNSSTQESIHIILPTTTIVNTMHVDELFITDGSFIDCTMVNSDSGATSSIDNSGNLVIRIKGVATGTIPYKVTVQYTKVTDVPGSGIFTQSAVPCIHYMTAEHVIGTWYDGRTMYERTFIPSTAVTISSGSSSAVAYVDETIRVIYSEVVTSDFTHLGSADCKNDGGDLKVTNNTSASVSVKYVTIHYIKVQS